VTCGAKKEGAINDSGENHARGGERKREKKESRRSGKERNFNPGHEREEKKISCYGTTGGAWGASRTVIAGGEKKDGGRLRYATPKKREKVYFPVAEKNRFLKGGKREVSST